MHLPESSNFTPAPSGAHRSICVGFIDLGTQKTEYQGQINHRRLVMIRWELVDELMEDHRPFTIAKRYTWSMSDKASLRKDLESWRGKPFEKADFGPGGFDTRKLLGVPALVTVAHAEKNGTIYANVAAVSPIPKTMQKPETPANAPVYFALEGSFDKAAYEKLSPKMKELIAESDEYKRLVHGVTRAEPDTRPDNGFDDEIPF